MATAKLVISSKNYSSWALRGWLLCRMAGLDFDEEIVSSDDPSMRAELLVLSPSTLVPRLIHDGMTIWDTLAIAEYLNETFPEAGLLPKERAARARCRSVSGEMHSGFSALRSGLPVNLRKFTPGFHVWSGAQADIDRITTIWRECLALSGGPFLFGAERSVADAMFAPVTTRFKTYDVAVDPVSAAYCRRILAMPEMIEWYADAAEEQDEIEELESEF
ncbi:glutathione S-transferase [Aliidongia dinghuensis]|uniref:Glutathione S-transferase n=1 Tax=Aliidongia dinghuensis TaxID=1867774 RepID=A0A8J2YZB5_9PROT|nr:glutathione S-transferase family protein [Aliidongia dinghuensis]GGF39978.1 glutathione S-transferase [Aliidongia dinghuensis]